MKGVCKFMKIHALFLIFSYFLCAGFTATSLEGRIYPEEELLNLVNSLRQEENISPLNHDWEASRVARHRAEDMLLHNYFGHDSPIYGSFFDMLDNFNISYQNAGENIAINIKNPQEVVDAWNACPDHRKNILSKNFTSAGVGYTPERHCWVLILY